MATGYFQEPRTGGDSGSSESSDGEENHSAAWRERKTRMNVANSDLDSDNLEKRLEEVVRDDRELTHIAAHSNR